ncbi:MAG: DUF1292 domain-containing protein [Clostridium sp.]|uniref:DUF1292 domain-containing protein n=1 Tax=Clostridium sp. TaxID=1506 RepID=UPI003060CA6A
MEEFLENITLTDEEGNDVEFEVVAKFVGEGTEYFIVAPIDSDDDDAIALKVVKGEDGEEYFATVEDEEEFNLVNETFETLMEEGII